MDIYEFISNYYSNLEVIEIFPDEDDKEAIKDYFSLRCIE